jgi:hypothetical protein
MPFDLKKFQKDVLAAAAGKKRRIPEPQPLAFTSAGYAHALLGKQFNQEQVLYFASGLQRAADLYYFAADRQAISKKRRGRPRQLADVAFVYGMIDLWVGIFGQLPKVRKYQNARKNERGGRELPTFFQTICREWMSFVDPDRPPLAPTAFKEGIEVYKRRRGGKKTIRSSK